MEALGAISEGVWSSLSGMYISEEADFMAKLLGKCSFPMELDGGSSFGLQPISWPSNESTLSLSAIGESSFYSLGITDSYSDMSNYNYQSENVVLSGNSSDHERYYFGDSSPFLATNSTSISMDYCPKQDSSESSESLKETAPFQENYASRVEFESEMQQELSPRADENNVSSVHFKKRPRDIEDLPKTNGKNTKQKTVRRLDFCGNNDELDSQVACPNGSSSSPCNSEEDSNGGVTTCSSLTSKENVAVHPNGKMRASRGSATDPQSLYARKRRERINERLRILQNLVPNGTKVDISTMLEEAVHYVKFLQLQIKLLSSDELWMYAPLAYNGMDINLDLKTSRRR